jgi:hypothetical protein
MADGRTGWASPFAEVATDEGEPHPLPLTAIPSEHLLKVAGAEALDAAKLWAELWGQLRQHITADGRVMPEMQKGFVPACGWREFLEKFWLLKHHLDSASRVCKHQ